MDSRIFDRLWRCRLSRFALESQPKKIKDWVVVAYNRHYATSKLKALVSQFFPSNNDSQSNTQKVGHAADL